jgi:lipoate-protein ligase B
VTLPFRWLGSIGHAAAVERMERARDAAIAAGLEVLLLCRHPPVITLGRSASRDDIRATSAELEAAGVEVVEASRGGLVTYHDPGQLMVYPVIRLRGGVVSTLAAIAAGLADTAAELGVSGARWRRDPAGLWVGDRKLAACGVHIRRRVLIHGFAFNVATDPAAWAAIVPCGLPGQPHVSVAELTGRRHEIAAVAEIAGPRISARLTEPARKLHAT